MVSGCRGPGLFEVYATEVKMNETWHTPQKKQRFHHGYDVAHMQADMAADSAPIRQQLRRGDEKRGGPYRAQAKQKVFLVTRARETVRQYLTALCCLDDETQENLHPGMQLKSSNQARASLPWAGPQISKISDTARTSTFGATMCVPAW